MNEAYMELKSIGLKERWVKSLGYAFAISLDAGGQGFYCTRKGNHEIDERHFLPFNQLPNLAMEFQMLVRTDLKLRNSGGRVFVAPSGFFRRCRNSHIWKIGDASGN